MVEMIIMNFFYVTRYTQIFIWFIIISRHKMDLGHIARCSLALSFIITRSQNLKKVGN